MPKIVGYTDYHSDNPNAVVAEEDFEITSLRIENKGEINGKNVYGLFVTDKEWKEKVSAVVCSDGWYKVPLVEYEEGEAIQIGIPSVPVDDSEIERINSKRDEENFACTEAWMRKELVKLGIPVRKIKPWHRLRWKAFAE